MTEPEGFLNRWTRRKRDAMRPDSESAERERTPDSAEPGAPETEQTRGSSSGDVARTKNSPSGAEGEQEPAFDLSKLPSIESITAETDIRPFLARGVPADLRNAALRRAWITDPHIRDFIGIAENQGDFTGAGTMPGFDFSPPTGDVARMVAEIFGEREKNESSSGESAADAAVVKTERPLVADASNDHRKVNPVRPVDDIGSVEPFPAGIGPDSSVRRSVNAPEIEKNIAPQNNDAAREEKIQIARRSHGGAMPK